MADPFVAEIRIFPFNFAPRGWAFCDGQLLPISQNTALFSLVGTMYGGDGKTSFALPNLQGSAPMSRGQGPGLSLRNQGETGGSSTVTLLESEIPSHTHAMRANSSVADFSIPQGNSLANTAGDQIYRTDSQNLTQMASQSLGNIGGDQPHNNMQPYLTLNFCIALQGVYPPRT